MNSLVICEKPSQARNVRDAIGSKYGTVLSARGHLLQLASPKDVNPDWKVWGYEVLRPESGFYPFVPDGSFGKDKVIAELGAAIKKADRVIIATDCDREGQAIGENIVRHFKFRGDVFRVMFSAEDPETLRESFAKMKPNAEFLPLYQAAFARVQVDQITNLSMTRAASLALKPPSMKGAIGIGRVKTPTMGIVCRREAEIAAFTARNFFDLHMDVSEGQETLRLKWSPKEEFRIHDAQEAATIATTLKSWSGNVAVKKEQKKQSPPKLMDLPTLQQRASRWGWSAKRTLDVAQALYETHKITTYPRAENKYLPEVEIANAPAMLAALKDLPFGGVSYDAPTIRKGKSGMFSDKALEGSSHHAIVPNVKTRSSWANILPKLSTDERKMFELIAKTYLAAIGPDRLYDRTEITAKAAERLFTVSGTVDRVLGWREAMGQELDENEGGKDDDGPKSLPNWQDGTAVKAVGAGVDKKITKPPARYTEGSLIKAMQEAWKFADDPARAERLKEAKGIGTPATRDTIIEGLKKQNFFELNKGQLKASELAMAIYELLLREAPEVLDPAATAEMEIALDEILSGKANPRDVVDMLVAKAEVFVQKFRDYGQNGKPLDIKMDRKPSPKMLAAARSKAKRDGVKLPRGSTTNYDVCSDFLGPRPVGNAPSEAALKFGQKIAGEAGLELSEDVLADRTALSKWIDKNKGKMPAQGQAGGEADTPTSKQVGFAEQIATRKGIEVPPETLRSRSSLSKWIDTNAGAKGKRKKSRS
jgi:DNA topoisomerase-3